jgi:hypothetical protein
MRKASQFSKSRVLYWPEEFSAIMDLLTGRDSDGRATGPALYQFNTGALTLAAAVGLRCKRKRDIGGSRKKEISTDTFAAHGLEALILLVPLLGNPAAATEMLRVENEEELIREFERYAAGGLEVLMGEFDELAGQSPDFIVQQLYAKHGGAEENNRGGRLPNLF